MSIVRTIHLGGWLGKKYGKVHKLAGKSLWHLTQGLIHRLGNEFREDVRNHTWHATKGKKSSTDDIGELEVRTALGDTKTLWLFPAVEGSSGAVRTIVGIVLVVVGLIYNQPWLVNIGASLALGGVIEMLTRPPKGGQPTDDANKKQSYLFNGPVNTMEEGGALPLVFGRVGRCGSTVISVGFTNEVI